MNGGLFIQLVLVVGFLVLEKNGSSHTTGKEWKKVGKEWKRLEKNGTVKSSRNTTGSGFQIGGCTCCLCGWGKRTLVFSAD